MLDLAVFIREFHYNEDLLTFVRQQNGWQHGINIWYYSNGSINMFRHWFNGKSHGINIWCYQDGGYCVYYTHRGIQYGISIHYQSNGTIMAVNHNRVRHNIKVEYQLGVRAARYSPGTTVQN